MKLAEIHFDWAPVIPGADHRGENLVFPLRGTSCFKAADGWSIEVLSGERFRLHREGMPLPVIVGDGYSYIEPAAPTVEGPVASGLGLAISEQALSSTEMNAEQLLRGAAQAKRRKVKP